MARVDLMKVLTATHSAQTRDGQNVNEAELE